MSNQKKLTISIGSLVDEDDKGACVGNANGFVKFEPISFEFELVKHLNLDNIK